MSDPIPSATRSPSPADVTPTALQAVLTIVGGLGLAAGTCAGFLATLNLNRESAVNIAFALGFFAGLIASLIGVTLIIVRAVRLSRLRRELRAGQPGSVLATDTPRSTSAAPTAPQGRMSAVIEDGPASKPLVVAGVLLLAAIGFVVMLVDAGASAIAFLFLTLAAASMVGSVLSLVVAAIRYGRGR